MVSPARRRWLGRALQAGGGLGLAALGLPARATLQWPRDHGAHPETRTEWWYVTGWLGRGEGPAAQPEQGFQITFFRSRTGLAAGLPGRFAPRQLLFAHAAVTDLARGRFGHDQRIARWTGAPGAEPDHAALDDARLRLAGWTLRDEGAQWRASIAGDGFALQLTLTPTQPLLLEGPEGRSRKGPGPDDFSHYYSLPQLAVAGDVEIDGRRAHGAGRAWLDHEWSDHYLPAQAVGWDWIGMNLFDGSTLMAFAIRRADGSALWAGGSWRRPGAAALYFLPAELRLVPGRRWQSPASGARYPVQWQIDTPAGRFGVRALLQAQELDSRASTGTIYWEGLSELLDERGRRIGLGYLEMTGYAGPLQL
ncbi:MAG: carotenoid 1,2-hydratase [Burkholderiales bacterium]|nr:carotenoid 1,2-hydratase [Burkholderiales bacterium]